MNSALSNILNTRLENTPKPVTLYKTAARNSLYTRIDLHLLDYYEKWICTSHLSRIITRCLDSYTKWWSENAHNGINILSERIFYHVWILYVI